MRFADRADAGRRLAGRLAGLQERGSVVLGLPRGGVPVAFEVAQALHAPLDVIVVRKLGVPGEPELAAGAVGERGVRVLNRGVLQRSGVTDAELEAAESRATAEVNRTLARLRQSHRAMPLAGRSVVIVDDGAATGATAEAACAVARALGARHVAAALPVATIDVVERLRAVADEVICLHIPPWLHAVGQFYDDFAPVSDEDVADLLTRTTRHYAAAGRSATEVRVDAGSPGLSLGLVGDLVLPADAHGLVVFAHGSGSSRHSPRNAYMARVLHDAHLGTLLFDLLTVGEAADRSNVFDIALLAGRLAAATAWVRRQAWAQDLPIGWFGASTGAAAALWAAAEPDADIAAIVSRGGRVDLAGPRLDRVKAPTLLIVGAADEVVLRLNRAAAARLPCPHELALVPGATHLFEEPGTLEVMAHLARDWFTRHLQRHAATARSR